MKTRLFTVLAAMCLSACNSSRGPEYTIPAEFGEVTVSPQTMAFDSEVRVKVSVSCPYGLRNVCILYMLDGDKLRRGLCGDLGFSDDDRIENIRRAAEVAGLFRDAGLVTLCTFISPFAAGRAEARRIADGRFLEVWVRAGLETCKARDPKKLYQKALEGKIRSFTGIDSPYEEPTDAELVLDTEVLSEEECVSRLTDAVFDCLEGGDTL